MRRGFLSQIVLLLALLLGIWLTIRFSGLVSKILISNFGVSASSTPLWAFGLTFAAVVVGVFCLASLFKGAMRVVRILWLDKLLGLAFGMLKGAMLVSVLLALLCRGGIMQRFVAGPVVEKSILYGPVRGLAPEVFPYLKDFGAAAWAQLTLQEEGS